MVEYLLGCKANLFTFGQASIVCSMAGCSKHMALSAGRQVNMLGRSRHNHMPSTYNPILEQLMPSLKASIQKTNSKLDLNIFFIHVYIGRNLQLRLLLMV